MNSYFCVSTLTDWLADLFTVKIGIGLVSSNFQSAQFECTRLLSSLASTTTLVWLLLPLLPYPGRYFRRYASRSVVQLGNTIGSWSIVILCDVKGIAIVFEKCWHLSHFWIFTSFDFSILFTKVLFNGKPPSLGYKPYVPRVPLITCLFSCPLANRDFIQALTMICFPYRRTCRCTPAASWCWRLPVTSRVEAAFDEFLTVADKKGEKLSSSRNPLIMTSLAGS